MKIAARFRGGYPARCVRVQLQTYPRHPAVHLFVATHAELPFYRDQAAHMRNHPVPLAGVEVNKHGGGWKIIRVAVGVFAHLHRASCEHKAARGGGFLLNHEAHQSNRTSVGLAQAVAEFKPCGPTGIRKKSPRRNSIALCVAALVMGCACAAPIHETMALTHKSRSAMAKFAARRMSGYRKRWCKWKFLWVTAYGRYVTTA